jgi:signal transduction histidine kinase
MSDSAIRIVVVDDNAATLYTTSHVLKSAGWTVLQARTGAEALAQITDDIDLVILDVQLPDMNGFDICRRLRQADLTARLPVIHLSASFVKDSDRIHGLEAGADGYLTHPVEPPVLIATVRAFLRARQAERDREALLISERAARADAERANRLKDDFLATLSHELRTPLHAIVGWTQLLKLGRLSPEEAAEGLEAIERNAHAQSQMIADLLDVSRITSGKLRLDVQPVDPQATIDAALSAVVPAAEAKGIRIQRILDPAAGPIWGDPSRLQQIVWNLVNNAVKFTPKDGRIQVTLAKRDSYVEICVEDNGQGIAPDVLDRIFDRFRQADSSSTREHGGLGLGLAICRQLVELHGGTIRAESEGLGRGARFVVALPLSVEAQRTPPVDLSRLAPTVDALTSNTLLDRVRILIVDDDQDARRMLMRILANSGAVIDDSGNVGEALASIPRFQPHVMVSDLGMPGRDGYELIRQVRSMGYGVRELPAVALSGFARPEDRRRALLAGFQVHVPKPVDPYELTATIAALVGRIGS